MDDDTTAAVIDRFYEIGVYPDWWKLEPMKRRSRMGERLRGNRAATTRTRAASSCSASTRRRTNSKRASPSAARHDLVKGFAVGRTIFGEAAQRWLAGEIDDGEAVRDMAGRYRRSATSGTRARVADGRRHA